MINIKLPTGEVKNIKKITMEQSVENISLYNIEILYETNEFIDVQVFIPKAKIEKGIVRTHQTENTELMNNKIINLSKLYEHTLELNFSLLENDTQQKEILKVKIPKCEEGEIYI